MMRAVRFHDYNGLSGVRIDQIPTPSVDPGALLVRVHAAGVNPFDRYAVEGYVNAFVSFTLPAVLGRDFSGVIEAVGAEVTGFMVGDAVFGQAAADAEGNFAAYLSIPVDCAAKNTKSITQLNAASPPNVLMAAWDELFSTARGLYLPPDCARSGLRGSHRGGRRGGHGVHGRGCGVRTGGSGRGRDLRGLCIDPCRSRRQETEDDIAHQCSISPQRADGRVGWAVLDGAWSRSPAWADDPRQRRSGRDRRRRDATRTLAWRAGDRHGIGGQSRSRP